MIFFLWITSALAQQTINSLTANNVFFPKETASRAVYLDGGKQLKSSSTVSDTELGYLDGVTSAIQTQLGLKADSTAVVNKSGNETITGNKTFNPSATGGAVTITQGQTGNALTITQTGTGNGIDLTGRLVVTSTTVPSKPCPAMTEAQRDITSAVAGDCVFNTDSDKLNIYDGASWVEAGGGAGGSRLQLLEDSSFESGVTEGTCTTCTASVELTEVMVTPNNLASLEMAFSASTGNYTIAKSTGAKFANVQGYASCWIKTNQAGITFTSRVDGADDKSVNVVAGDWKEYIIPMVLGTTSIGYKVAATSSITGDVYVDECYAGPMAASMTPEVSQAQVAASLFIASTASCTWTVTNTAFTDFATVAACPGPTIISNVSGTAQTTDSDLPQFTFNNLPPGRYVGVLSSVTTRGVTAAQTNCIRITDGTTNGRGTCNANSATAEYRNGTAVIEVEYTSTANRTFKLQGRAGSGAIELINAGATDADGVVFTLYSYPPASKVYSQLSPDGDWVSCGLTTADFTGFGTVSSIQDQCKKDGSDLLIRLKFTSGTSTAVEARVNLELLGTSLTSASSTIIPSIQSVGTFGRGLASTNQKGGLVHVAPSLGYITFSDSFVFGSGSVNPLLAANGTAVVSTGEAISLYARVPINGWTKSQITGTFANVVTTPGVSKPKTCYYFFGGSGTTLAAPVECTTGTCTEQYDSCGTGTPPARGAAGSYTDLTFASGTWANTTPVMCECAAYDTVSTNDLDCLSLFFTGDHTWATNASGGLILNLGTFRAAGTTNDGYVALECTGQAP